MGTLTTTTVIDGSKDRTGMIGRAVGKTHATGEGQQTCPACCVQWFPLLAWSGLKDASPTSRHQLTVTV